jgi:hypothetical protein
MSTSRRVMPDTRCGHSDLTMSIYNMSMKEISAAAFKAQCLNLIGERTLHPALLRDYNTRQTGRETGTHQ